MRMSSETQKVETTQSLTVEPTDEEEREREREREVMWIWTLEAQE